LALPERRQHALTSVYDDCEVKKTHTTAGADNNTSLRQAMPERAIADLFLATITSLIAIVSRGKAHGRGNTAVGGIGLLGP